MDSAHSRNSTSSSTSTRVGDSLPPTWSTDSPPEFIPPKTIPQKHDRRTIVLCFDGTGDKFDDDASPNTNVVRFFSMLKKDDPEKQVVYYQTGIGVRATPQYFSTIANKISSAHDWAVAATFDDHVKDGYQFLVQNYKSGDKICLFGFSRGAYTARALAGMLYKVGLLAHNNCHQIPYAYNIYKDETSWEKANEFKLSFSIDVKIYLLGVWDTVCSVGFFPNKLPYASSNDSVIYFRHAMGLDERRTKFQLDPWNEPEEKDRHLGKTNYTTLVPKVEGCTNVEEVWFAGCHGDIGGGPTKNGVPHALARNPLRWMIRECFKTGTGIMFYVDALRNLGFAVSSDSESITSPKDVSFSPGPLKIQTEDPEELKPPQCTVKTEAENEVLDSLMPVHDPLVPAHGGLKKWIWWLMEALPLPSNVLARNPDGTTTPSWTIAPHLAARREIPEGTILVHRSVRTRMEAENASELYPVHPDLLKRIKHDQVKWIE